MLGFGSAVPVAGHVSHFPNIDQIEAVLTAWPRLFARATVGMQPLVIDDGTLVVLCQVPHLVEFINEQQQELISDLNRLLDGEVVIAAIRPVSATSTEIYLARELLALKIWLRDFDVGF